MRQLEPTKRACLKNKREKERQRKREGEEVLLFTRHFEFIRIEAGVCLSDGFARQLMGRGTSNRSGPTPNNEL